MKHPPELASEILILTLNDLELCEKDSNYTIDMEAWHGSTDQLASNCPVCAAGAVMAKTCELPIDTIIDHPSNYFSDEWTDVFLFINDICEAIYDYGDRGFKQEIRDMIEEFKSSPDWDRSF